MFFSKGFSMAALAVLVSVVLAAPHGGPPPPPDNNHHDDHHDDQSSQSSGGCQPWSSYTDDPYNTCNDPSGVLSSNWLGVTGVADN